MSKAIAERQDKAGKSNKEEIKAWVCHVEPRYTTEHILYGNSEAILHQMDQLSINLMERRVFALAVEGENRAELRFFEHAGDNSDNWNVYIWRAEDLQDVPSKLSQAIMENKGVHCVGEQMKIKFLSSVGDTEAAVASAPVSARAAFAHTIKDVAQDNYISAKIFIAC